MSINQTPNVVAFSRGLLIRKEPDQIYSESLRNDRETATLQAELIRLGFMLDHDAFIHLTKWRPEDAARYFNEVLPAAKEIVGSKRNYRPLYKNFPQEVMDTSTFELMLNALRHYWSNGTWEPDQELVERGVAFEQTEFRSIKLVTEAEFKQIFKKLVGVNAALAAGDRQLVEWFVKWYGHDLPLPKSVPFKETLCILASFGLDVPVKTTTDVLRIARFISGGDPSLPAVPKLPKQKEKKKPAMLSIDEVFAKGFAMAFRTKRETLMRQRRLFQFAHVRRSSRRYLLGLLEKTNLDTSEMQQRLEQWLRLGEVLHPGEYRRQFPRTYAAFQALRNQPPRIRSYHGQLDLAQAAGDLDQLLELLARRPGEFARRIDWFLRTYEKSEDLDHILESFARVAPRISSKVLLELYGHLCARLKSKPRAVSLKLGKMKRLEALPPLNEANVQRVQPILLGALGKLFETLPPLGKVWIDERLKNVVLPTAMRKMNRGLATYTRGTRIPFRADAGTVRAFVHWYDQHGREDIDLSAAFFDKDFLQIGHISYTELKNPKLGAYHSGDVRARKGSCAEYIDIDIEKAQTQGARYVTVHVYNFNAGSLESLSECKFGLMERERPYSNEIFEPRTVSNAVNLKNQSSSVLLCAIDLVDKSYLWMEVEMDRARAYIENTFSQTSALLSALVDPNRLTVYELLTLHANARGTLVENSEEADVSFAFEDFVADYAKIAEFITVTPPEEAR